MHISDEFFKFCDGLQQDLERYGPEVQDWIDGALRSVDEDRLPIFSNYLTSLLSENYSDGELKEIFRRTDTDTSFLVIHDPRNFLRMVRDTIESKLSQAVWK